MILYTSILVRKKSKLYVRNGYEDGTELELKPF